MQWTFNDVSGKLDCVLSVGPPICWYSCERHSRINDLGTGWVLQAPELASSRQDGYIGAARGWQLAGVSLLKQHTLGFIAICLCEIGSTGIWSGPSQHLARLSTVKKQQIDLRWMGFFHRNQWFSRSTSRLTDFQKIFPDRFWVTKETQVPVARLGKSNEILTENVVTLDDMLTHAHSFLWNCMKSSFLGAWTALCWWFWFKHATSLLPGIVW